MKKSQHRYVIGPRGNAINEILAETGVFVEMPSNADESETITLRGPQEKLGLALTKVYEKANSVVNLVLPCPTWLHKYIIGKKGAGIQRISQDLPKVHIVFQDDGTIKVDGPPDEVEKARLDLEDQVSKLVKETAFADVKVDAKYHKHIIGKGGSTINKIKSEADVTINIPDTDSGATVIRIEGNKAGVEKAKAELASMVDKMENEKEKDLIVENRFHRQLIGAKGGEIEKIRKEFHRTVMGVQGSKVAIAKMESDAEIDELLSDIEEGEVRDEPGNDFSGLFYEDLSVNDPEIRRIRRAFAWVYQRCPHLPKATGFQVADIGDLALCIVKSNTIKVDRRYVQRCSFCNLVATILHELGHVWTVRHGTAYDRTQHDETWEFEVGKASTHLPWWLVMTAQRASGPVIGPCHLRDPHLSRNWSRCLLCECESVCCMFCGVVFGTIVERMEHENLPHKSPAVDPRMHLVIAYPPFLPLHPEGYSFSLHVEVFPEHPMAKFLHAADMAGMTFTRVEDEENGTYLQAHHMAITEEGNKTGSKTPECNCSALDLPPFAKALRGEGSTYKKAIGLFSFIKSPPCKAFFVNLTPSLTFDQKFNAVGRFVAGEFDSLVFHSSMANPTIVSTSPVNIKVTSI